jgi:tRNA pseudouridine38-40 synthase
MTRWKLTIEYDGSGFSGWQRQNHALSVQQVIEEAIEKFSSESAALFVAGRTDAGVHAAAQVAHFDLEKEITGDKIRDAINFHVRPHKVAIVKAEEVPPDFHARFSALSRSYRYTVFNRRAPSVLTPLVWHIERELDVPAMQEAGKILLGHHDFSTFRAQNCQAKSPIKTLDKLDIAREGERIFFDVRARSFLYHQVRNMVGTLAMVGSGQWSVAQFAEAFAACDRTKGGPTAPPQGLCLMEVEYPS